MKIIANNKRAFHDYFIEATFEAGVELLGWEVKSCRAAEVSLAECYVTFRGESAFVKNSYFAPYKQGNVNEQDNRRDRRLLLHRHELDKLIKGVKIKGYTCVVTKLYFNRQGRVKAEIALAKGKQNYDKKQTLKEKDLQREADKAVKDKGN